MSRSPKAVVFDYGQVLSFREKAEHLKRIAARCNVDYERFLDSYERYMPEYDRGDLGGKEFWHKVLPLLGVEPSETLINSFIEEDTASPLMLNPAMLAWAELLRRKGVGTGILSNMSQDDLARMRGAGILEQLSGFSVRIFSSEVGIIKPDAAIYRLYLSRLGRPAQETLFIDDNQANVDAAKDEGMATFLFLDFETSVPEICRQHSLPSPSKNRPEKWPNS
jgi:putative hydrolase of the HAD superfamily